MFNKSCLVVAVAVAVAVAVVVAAVVSVGFFQTVTANAILRA